MRGLLFFRRRIHGALLVLTICAFCAPTPDAAQSTTQATTGEGVLTRDQATPLMPATVFYAGQTAPVQARNSAGVRFPGGKLLLAAMVDTSGYSSGIQQSYQAYLITETPISLGDKTLQPGAYGFGFVAGDKMVVMDLGGGLLINTSTQRDSQMTRPTPLQIQSAPGAQGHYRLYLGRSFVEFAAAPNGK